jgi:hypothetical protein
MSSLKPDHTTKSHKSLEADSYKKSAAGLADHSSGGAKRGGGGSHNWGSVDDEIRDAVREHQEESRSRSASKS